MRLYTPEQLENFNIPDYTPEELKSFRDSNPPKYEVAPNLTEDGIYVRLADRKFSNGNLMNLKSLKKEKASMKYRVNYMKTWYPIIEEEKEFIPVKEWDLDGIVGHTKDQIYHPHFDIAKKYFMENWKPQYKNLVICLCTFTKPYRWGKQLSALAKLYSSKERNFDWCIISNPGVIPIDYDNHYPIRYYHWTGGETAEDKLCYIRACIDRLVEWLEYYKTKGHVWDKIIYYGLREGKTLTAIKVLQGINPEDIDYCKENFTPEQMVQLKTDKRIPFVIVPDQEWYETVWPNVLAAFRGFAGFARSRLLCMPRCLNNLRKHLGLPEIPCKDLVEKEILVK